ncbi:hypothetical protein ANTRET_LOCUS8419 [Anthophora retusa]
MISNCKSVSYKDMSRLYSCLTSPLSKEMQVFMHSGSIPSGDRFSHGVRSAWCTRTRARSRRAGLERVISPRWIGRLGGAFATRVD